MQVLFEQSAPAPRHVFLLRPCKLVATHLLHLIVCHLNSTRVPDAGRVIKLPVPRVLWQHFTATGSSCDHSRFDPALVASCGSRCARRQSCGATDSRRKVSVGKDGSKEALANLHIRGELQLAEGDGRLQARPQARAGLGSPSDTS